MPEEKLGASASQGVPGFSSARGRLDTYFGALVDVVLCWSDTVILGPWGCPVKPSLGDEI